MDNSKHYAMAITCGAKRGPKNDDLTFSPASLRDFLKALVAPVQEQTDWEAVAADQAMTISMMKVDQEKAESAYQRGYMDGMAKQRKWVGLEPEEIAEILSVHYMYMSDLVHAIEAKLKEKNNE